MKYSFLKRFYNFIYRKIFNLLFSHSFKHFGKNVSIVSPDIIEGEEYISIDNNVSISSKCWLLAYKQDDVEPHFQICNAVTIGRFAHIVAIKKLVIEKNVLIADKVYISDNIHSYINVDLPIKDQQVEFSGEVIIGENSWIGENVSIIGAQIGKHCIIGANSVVTKNIPDYSVAVGVPAKVIKKYNFKKKIWEKNDES